MIDFDALVLSPCMEVFARPVLVEPIASQPDAPAYIARGVWSSQPIDVQLEDGSIMSSQRHKLGIRASEYTVPIVQGDQITIDAYMSLPRIGVCLVDDSDDDGQGGSELSLKVVGP